MFCPRREAEASPGVRHGQARKRPTEVGIGGIGIGIGPRVGFGFGFGIGIGFGFGFGIGFGIGITKGKGRGKGKGKGTGTGTGTGRLAMGPLLWSGPMRYVQRMPPHRWVGMALLGMLLTPLGSTATAQTPPPVVVIPIPGEGLTAEIAETSVAALTRALTPLVSGRTVQPALGAVQAVLACTVPEPTPENPAPTIDPCLGAQIAAAGGAAGVFVRVSVQSGVLHLDIAVREPMSGVLRVEPLNVQVPVAEAATADALTAVLSARLGPLAAGMPEPPTRTTLLLAVNQDGATVSIDGAPVGQTPLAPLEVAPGNHTISVTARGAQPFNRSMDVSLDGARVNIDLEPLPEQAAQLAAQDAQEADSFVTAEASTSGEPLYKKWWLWAAVGGAVVVIAAIIIGVAVAGGSDTPSGFEVPPIPGRGTP